MNTRDRTAPETRRAFSRRDFVTDTAMVGAGVALGPVLWATGSAQRADLDHQTNHRSGTLSDGARKMKHDNSADWRSQRSELVR
jgi:hypothetical protein